MVNVELEPIMQDIESGWLLWNVVKLEVSVTESPADYASRRLTATMEAPENGPILLAVPLFPGDGPVPEGALQMQNLSDQGQLMIQTLENAISETVKAKQQEKGW